MKRPPTPADCHAWALFLDIDGTLLDLARTPEGIQMPAELPALLRTLALGLGGCLVLVSGRPLAGIDGLFPSQGDAVGTHGAEWRLGGQPGMLDPAHGLDLERLADRLENRMRRWPGVLLERKPYGIALHYRLAPEREAQVWDLARDTLKTLGPGFRLQPGKSVAEILPAQASKGEAIRRFMGLRPYIGRTPVFAGDDLTDESGFAAVNALGGISIHVGEGDDTQARHGLPSPAALRAWLAELATHLHRPVPEERLQS